MAELFVQQTHVLSAPRQDVFAALSDPAQVARWWGPEGFSIPAIDFEPRVGSGYRIAMQPPEGDAFQLSGTFREVEPPHRLVLSFGWNPPTPDDRETVAELDLNGAGGQTEVALRHGPFATEERRSLHDAGWADSFAKLERLLAG